MLPIFLLAAAKPAVPATICIGGLQIAHSNRNVHYPCAGSLGDECAFSCDHGYVAIGRHVCQTYAAGGTTFINSSYFGGRCERLCSGAPTCSASEAAIRVNTTDPLGACFSTRCLSSADAALRKLARGNVEVWRRARHNTSGLYMDGVNLVDAHWTTTRASTGVTGLGLMMEVVAHALGWQKLVALEERVTLTLRTLIGRTPGVAIPRDDRGFFVHFVDAATGAQPGPADSSCLMCSGLLMAGALFTRSYLEEVDPDGAHEVGRLVQDLWDSIEFDKLLCDTSRDVVSPKNGSGIPMTLAIHGDACPNGFQTPQKDGYYHFNEEHYTVWFSYVKACGEAVPGQCSHSAAEAMWNAWQGRRLHPNTFSPVGNYSLLSLWSGYLVQLPYYTTQFSSDAAYQHLFRSHWLADWTHFNKTLLAGERGRYGLGAGPTPAWCTEGHGYIADRLDAGDQSHCRIFSPYVTAGYLPVAPTLIRAQVLRGWGRGAFEPKVAAGWQGPRGHVSRGCFSLVCSLASTHSPLSSQMICLCARTLYTATRVAGRRGGRALRPSHRARCALAQGFA